MEKGNLNNRAGAVEGTWLTPRECSGTIKLPGWMVRLTNVVCAPGVSDFLARPAQQHPQPRRLHPTSTPFRSHIPGLVSAGLDKIHPDWTLLGYVLVYEPMTG